MDLSAIIKTQISAQPVQDRSGPEIARERQYTKIIKRCFNRVGGNMGGIGSGKISKTLDGFQVCAVCCERKELTIVNFYFIKSADKFDYYCKKCRIAHSTKCNQEQRKKHPSDHGIINKNEDYNRSNEIKYKKYMQQNPQYFEDVFNIPATPENINRAANQLF